MVYTLTNDINDVMKCSKLGGAASCSICVMNVLSRHFMVNKEYRPGKTFLFAKFMQHFSSTLWLVGGGVAVQWLVCQMFDQNIVRSEGWWFKAQFLVIT